MYLRRRRSPPLLRRPLGSLAQDSNVSRTGLVYMFLCKGKRVYLPAHHSWMQLWRWSCYAFFFFLNMAINIYDLYHHFSHKFASQSRSCWDSYGSLYGSGLALGKKSTKKQAIENVVQLCWLTVRSEESYSRLKSTFPWQIYSVHKKDAQCFSTEHADAKNALLHNFRLRMLVWKHLVNSYWL